MTTRCDLKIPYQKVAQDLVALIGSLPDITSEQLQAAKEIGSQLDANSREMERWASYFHRNCVPRDLGSSGIAIHRAVGQGVDNFVYDDSSPGTRQDIPDMNLNVPVVVDDRLWIVFHCTWHSDDHLPAYFDIAVDGTGIHPLDVPWWSGGSHAGTSVAGGDQQTVGFEGAIGYEVQAGDIVSGHVNVKARFEPFGTGTPALVQNHVNQSIPTLTVLNLGPGVFP